MSLPIHIRRANPNDMPFVYSSWLRSFKGSRDPHVSCEVYFDEHHDVINTIIDHACTTVLVATPKDDPDTILGWCVKTNDTLHYVYVKEAFRRMGLGKTLVGEFKRHSHLTPYGQKALGDYPSVYNPYAATSHVK